MFTNEDEATYAKLIPLKQWYCDTCGEVIKEDKEAMLEWDSYIEEEKGIIAENFRIVHHQKFFGNCQTPRGRDANLSDGHLHWYTGGQGLSELLDIQRRYVLDVNEFNRIIRRLHVEYYEEAMRYYPNAFEDNPEIDPEDSGHFTKDNLIWMIDKYIDKP